MGLDLTLMPFDCDLPELSFSHTIIQYSRDSDLFHPLLHLNPTQPVPSDFTTYLGHCDGCGERRYGATTETPYGEPLQCVRVDQLLEVPEPLWKANNLPVLAYLHALDRARRIALYWN